MSYFYYMCDYQVFELYGYLIEIKHFFRVGMIDVMGRAIII